MNIITYTKDNQSYHIDADRVYFIKSGTIVRFDSGQKAPLKENLRVHPIFIGDDVPGVYHRCIYFDPASDVLVKIVLKDYTEACDDFIFRSSNIIQEDQTFKVGRAYWDDMPHSYDWDPYMIWFDDDLKDEGLLSLDYLNQFAHEASLQPLIEEMTAKGYDYLWIV